MDSSKIKRTRAQRRVAAACTLAILFVAALPACSVGKPSTREVFAQKDSKGAKQLYSLLKSSPYLVEDISGQPISHQNIAVERHWTGDICTTTVRNIGDTALYPKDIIIFDIPRHGLDPQSPVYGEGFQMLHQNAGTLADRKDIGNNSDTGHYGIPDLHNMPTAYGVLTIDLAMVENVLLGFTSCRRFIGSISYDDDSLLISVDAEGLKLDVGETWRLEDFMFISGAKQGELFKRLAEEIEENHPAIMNGTVPTGWCSWYCYRMNITERIEAYRRGMQAMLRGCDEDTVVLGCNAPIWPSFGLVSAMRTSGDIRRKWSTVRDLAVQNLSRAWQNGKLWHTDPDCVVLAANDIFNVIEELSDNEWMFHATSIHATGGMVLSGDRAEDITGDRLRILKKLLEPTDKGAIFKDRKMRIGVTDLGDRQYYYFFNRGETELSDMKVDLKLDSRLYDFWTGRNLGVHSGTYTLDTLPPHSARLIMAMPE